MRNAQELAGRIRSVVRHGEPAPAEELRALALEYRGQCSAAQARLRHCVDLLARGLRSEAIHEADSPPPLLELIGHLEFPEAGHWRLWAAQSGLPVPEPFDSEQIRLLEQEYGNQTQTEPLVNLYRKLAIKQAPAAERIPVLRRLRQADPQNPNWARDLEPLEVERWKEIAAELREHRAELDELRLAKWLAEMTDPRSLTKPPPALKAEVAALHRELRAARAEAQMGELAQKVNEAYAAGDLDATSAALTEIDRLAAGDPAGVPAEVAESTAEARAWCAEQYAALEQEREFAREYQALEAALEGPERDDPDALHRRMRRVAAFAREEASELIAQARRQAESVVARRRRATMIRVGAIVGSLLLVLLVAAGAIWHARESRQREELAGRIDAFTKTMDLEGGRRLIEQVRREAPSRLADAKVVAAVAEFQRAEAADNQRAADLAATLTQASKLPHNDPEVRALLASAERLARTDAERRRVRDLRLQVESRRLGEQRAIDERLAAAVEEVSDRYDAVRQATEPQQIRELARAMDAALSRAESISGASPALSEKVRDFRRRHTEELARAQAIAQERDQKQRAREAMLAEFAAARSKLPDVRAYAAELAALEKKHAGAPQALGLNVPTDVARWEAAAPLYDAVLRLERVLDDAWRGKVDLSKPDGPIGLAAVELTRKLDEAGFGTEPPPEAAAAAEAPAPAATQPAATQPAATGPAPVPPPAPTPRAPALAILRARAAQVAEFEAHAADLRDRLEHPMIRRAVQFVIKSRDGAETRYYAPPDAKVQRVPSAVQASHFDKQHQVKNNALLIGTLVGSVEPAAHTKLADALAERLRVEQAAPGLFSGVPAMLAFTGSYKDVNPRVQVMLLELLVALNDAQGNPAELDEPLREAIKALAPDPVQFLAPSDDVEVTAALRNIARRLADLAPKLEAHVAAVRKRREEATIPTLAALGRRLAVTATAERAAPDGPVAVSPLGSARFKEYWTVEQRDGRVVFVVAAVSEGASENEGRWRWIVRPLPGAGMPLLSPEDRLWTADLLRGARKNVNAPIPDGWPVNADVARPPR